LTALSPGGLDQHSGLLDRARDDRGKASGVPGCATIPGRCATVVTSGSLLMRGFFLLRFDR
jgi:hypothetical protein